jgi:hypothetical protein
MRVIKRIQSLLFLVVLLPHTPLTAQTVRVLVLDALSAKPQTGVEVIYYCTGLRHNTPSKSVMTNSEGFAEFTYPCSNEEKVEIGALPPHPKEGCGGGPDPLTFEEISSVGVITKPDSAGGIWCPTKKSKNLKPVPGQVVMFVKKPTWWQSHVAG